MRNVTRILTLKNGYHIWTHTNNLGGKTKLLCLHGGPGDTHEVFERFGPELAALDIEVTMYDQLGSWYSDTPDWDDPAVKADYLTEAYYLSEVDEVRQLFGGTFLGWHARNDLRRPTSRTAGRSNHY